MTEVPKSPMVIPQLIVGLGNPEPKYDQHATTSDLPLLMPWAVPGRFQCPKIASFGVWKVGDHKQTKSACWSHSPIWIALQAIRAVTDWFAAAVGAGDLWRYGFAVGKIRLRLSGSAGAQWYEKRDRTPWQPKFPACESALDPKVQSDDPLSLHNEGFAAETQLMSEVPNLVVKCV